MSTRHDTFDEGDIWIYVCCDVYYVHTLKKRGGGLITYINKKHVLSSELLVDLNVSNEHIEAQWFLIHRPHCKNMVICYAYRPPNGEPLKPVSYLEDCVKVNNTSKINLFLLGDLNINYKDTSSQAKKLKFFIQSNGFTQHIYGTQLETQIKQTRSST